MDELKISKSEKTPDKLNQNSNEKIKMTKKLSK
jgi:hypothetical protein